MSYATTQNFDIGGDDVTIPVQRPGFSSEYMRAQNVHETWTGAVRVADRGTSYWKTTMVVAMTSAQLSAWLTWIDTYADGAVNACTWVDHNGTSHASARVLKPGYDAKQIAGGVSDVEIIVRTAEEVF